MSIKICLDAGHYGKYNRSPANSNYYESEMNWKLHLLQKKYLEEYGAEVILTRSNQGTDLDLIERGKKAKGCDLFISDHSNAVGSKVNEDVDYVAVYHLTEDTTTKSDDVSKEIAKKLAPVIAEVMGTNQGYQVLTRKIDSDRNNDGILNDNYYGVLHGARLVNVPAMIIEHSFHTNTKMTKWLMDDNNLDRLAKAEADVIAKHFGLSKTKTETNKVIYRVQVGAYSQKANADAVLSKLKAAGFDGFITTDGGKGASSENETETPVVKKIEVGATVKVKQGAKTYTGGNIADFAYNRYHIVSEIKGDRAVITFNGVVVAAVHTSDLVI